NFKDFWYRWHMTLSFWFRDYIYMRFSFFAMKKKLFKNRIRLSQVSYFLLFLIQGFWHGLTWYYIVYGIFHASAICINDMWLRFKGKHKKQIPSNKFTEWFAIFRSEEHTSELQSRFDLVCRLLLEKQNLARINN